MRIEEISEEKISKSSINDLYQLRLRSRQFYEKYTQFEKDNLFINVDWEDFFSKYGILMSEFKMRELNFNKWEMDSALYYRTSLTEDFQIKVLGTMAQTKSSLGNHFSLLISKGGKNVLIDPAIHRSKIAEDIDGIIITQADKDHWVYVKEFEKSSVYSTGAILDALPPNDFHPILKPLGFDGLVIRPIKTVHKVGVPSIGIGISFGDTKISILPEFMNLSKVARESITKTVWIMGCNNFEKDDVKAGKLSFKSLMKLAGELKPKIIYLTNLTKDILKHEDEVNAELEKYNGRILKDNDVLTIDDFRKRIRKKLKKEINLETKIDNKSNPVDKALETG